MYDMGLLRAHGKRDVVIVQAAFLANADSISRMYRHGKHAQYPI
jgi:hypothetical protein